MLNHFTHFNRLFMQNIGVIYITPKLRNKSKIAFTILKISRTISKNFFILNPHGNLYYLYRSYVIYISIYLRL